MRDVLLAEIPVVLRSDLDAVAALVGAAVVVGGSLLNAPLIITAPVGEACWFKARCHIECGNSIVILCFGLSGRDVVDSLE